MNQTEAGLDILNTGAGHIEVRFDNSDPLEIERAKRIITDMLKRGYVLFVEGADKKLSRVEGFNAESGCYIIADLSVPEPSAEMDVDAPRKRKAGRPRKTEVPIDTVKATAIGRSAGG